MNECRLPSDYLKVELDPNIRCSVHSYGFSTRHLSNATNRSNRPNIRHVLHLAWKNFITHLFHFRNDFLTESHHALISAHTHTLLLSTRLKHYTSIPDSSCAADVRHQPQWGFPLPKRSLYRHRVAFVETYQRSLPSVQSYIMEQKHSCLLTQTTVELAVFTFICYQ